MVMTYEPKAVGDSPDNGVDGKVYRILHVEASEDVIEAYIKGAKYIDRLDYTFAETITEVEHMLNPGNVNRNYSGLLIDYNLTNMMDNKEKSINGVQIAEYAIKKGYSGPIIFFSADQEQALDLRESIDKSRVLSIYQERGENIYLLSQENQPSADVLESIVSNLDNSIKNPLPSYKARKDSQTLEEKPNYNFAKVKSKLDLLKNQMQYS